MRAFTVSCGRQPNFTEPDLSFVAPPALQPGDAVRVRVWREGDLSGEFQVDQRGVVTLPLLGEREITGMHPDSLRDRLVVEYREYLQNPSVEVTLLRRISVLGEVRLPGLYALDGTMTLADAIARAGGLTPDGKQDDIRLLRDGIEIRTDLGTEFLVGSADLRSGDQIVVTRKGWLARNPGALVGSLIAAAAVITTALINN
ncbi:MAG: polysaccharide biosynthesis/export family protein [Gemmatimonadota bacterium]